MPGHVIVLSPKNCPFASGDLDTYLVQRSSSPPEPNTQMASRLVQPFLHSSLQCVPIIYNGRPFLHSKLPLPIGIWTPSNIWFFVPTWAHIPNDINRFSCFCTTCRRVSLYFTMGRSFPLENCPFPWGIWTPSNAWFLESTRAHNPNIVSIGSAVFAGLTTVTDRQTMLLGL